MRITRSYSPITQWVVFSNIAMRWCIARHVREAKSWKTVLFWSAYYWY
jgi:hypothetical protein